MCGVNLNKWRETQREWRNSLAVQMRGAVSYPLPFFCLVFTNTPNKREKREGLGQGWL